MKMLSVIFVILIFNAATHSFTEIAEIRISYSTRDDENFTAWIDEPMTIIIDQTNTVYTWCVDKNAKPGGSFSSEFVPETEFSNYEAQILNIPKVTAEMSTRWRCTFLMRWSSMENMYPHKGRNYTAHHIEFNLYVKGERQVILTANNQNVKYDVKTGLSVKYYRLANYTYEDGEDVEFSCKKAQDETHPSDTVRLEYFKSDGIRLFQSEPGTTMHKFRSVLNVSNDKYYLDCVCASTEPFRECRYRTTFYMKKDAEEHAIKLFINGQRLTTLSNNEPKIDDYIFRYIDGEELNVTCQEIHSFSKGTVLFSFDRNLNYQEVPEDQEMGIGSLKLLASNVNNKTITCHIFNVGVDTPVARILLSSDVPQHGTHVLGLPRNNVLYQYTNDRGQWTIGYQYSVNDTLSLTCVAQTGLLRVSPNHNGSLYVSPFFRWNFDDVAIDSSANWTQTLPGIVTSDKVTKILNAKHSGTKIKCTYFPKGESDIDVNKTVEILLRLKPEQIYTGEAPTYSSNNDTLFYTSIYCLPAIGVGVILVVLYYTIIRKRCCVRTSAPIPAPRIDPASVFYENLLAVFRPINEREAAEENHYEEIE